MHYLTIMSEIMNKMSENMNKMSDLGNVHHYISGYGLKGRVVNQNVLFLEQSLKTLPEDILEKERHICKQGS